MNFEKMPVTELRQLAKERGIRNSSKMVKADLIAALKAAEQKPAAAEKKPAPPNQEIRSRVVEQKVVEHRPQEAASAPKQTATAPQAPKQTTQPAAQAPQQPASANQGQAPQQSRRPQGQPARTATRQMTGSRNYLQQAQRANMGGRNQGQASGQNQQQNNNAQAPAPAISAPVQNPGEYDSAQNPNTDQHSLNSPQATQAAQNSFESGEISALDSGEIKVGILEVMQEGFGFIRCDNYLPGENDVYVAPAQIRRFNLKTGDIVEGNTRIKAATEKFSALLYIRSVNGYPPSVAAKRHRFEDLTPIFPNKRLRLELPESVSIAGVRDNVAMRMVDLIAPIGKGQRGMIVSQPKAGKTTLLKQIATSIIHNYPEMHVIILLIDERPEEVTDMKESVSGKQVEVIYSTFDELPENHKRVSEMVIERAKRLVEHGEDVIILLDSITRLARAYNLTVNPSGRTLSGGLDPAALHMPKRFFGAARNMREGGSLTILATALVETGSRMDDVVYEEFKGTGNMELVLDRSLSEKRIFPAIDLAKSSTRRDDLLFDPAEAKANVQIRRALSSKNGDEGLENVIHMFRVTKNNRDTIKYLERIPLSSSGK